MTSRSSVRESKRAAMQCSRYRERAPKVCARNGTVNSTATRLLYGPLIGICLTLAGGGCGDSPTEPISCIDEEGCLSHFGLRGERIDGLDLTSIGMVAGTENRGVFRLTSDGWASLGLSHWRVSSAVAIPGRPRRLLAAVRSPAGGSTSEAAVYATPISDQFPEWTRWEPWDGGLGVENGRRLSARVLAVDPTDSSRVVFSTSGGLVLTEDRGRSWEFVHGGPQGGRAALDIEFDRSNPSRVWAAGTNSLEAPMVLRSDDGGRSWEFVFESYWICCNGFTGLLYDEDRGELWATASDVLFVSDDAGVTWDTGAHVPEFAGTIWDSVLLTDGRILFFGIGDPHGTIETGPSFHMRIFLFDPDTDEVREIRFEDRVHDLPGIWVAEALSDQTMLLGTSDGIFRWDLPDGWRLELD